MLEQHFTPKFLVVQLCVVALYGALAQVDNDVSVAGAVAALQDAYTDLVLVAIEDGAIRLKRGKLVKGGSFTGKADSPIKAKFNQAVVDALTEAAAAAYIAGQRATRRPPAPPKPPKPPVDPEVPPAPPAPPAPPVDNLAALRAESNRAMDDADEDAMEAAVAKWEALSNLFCWR